MREMNPATLAFVLATALCATTGLPAQTRSDRDLAPGGRLRVGVNASNATLVKRAPDGSLGGSALDLGTSIARALDAACEPVVYTGSGAITASFGKGEWEIVVTSVSPLIAPSVEYAGDVLQIDYLFVAAPSRTFTDAACVDGTGVTVAVGRNTSADAFLSRSLKSATLRRTSGELAESIDLLRTGAVDPYGTITDGAMAIADGLPGATLVPAHS